MNYQYYKSVTSLFTLTKEFVLHISISISLSLSLYIYIYISKRVKFTTIMPNYGVSINRSYPLSNVLRIEGQAL